MAGIGNVLILGDSYSTFEGFIPEGYVTWYIEKENELTDVTTVEQTWWHPLLKELGGTLLLNNSWSGTTICHTGYNGEDCSDRSFAARLDQLISMGFFVENRIDTLLIFGGTNDSWADAPVGELQYAGWKKQELYRVLPAFCYLLDRVKNALPKMNVLCIFNTELKTEILGGFEEACRRNKVDYIVLQNIEKSFSHPNAAGMRQIKEQVKEKLAFLSR